MADPEPDRARWLLFIHRLPKDPAYLRVKIGRRLARVGALLLKNSVYVLPLSDGSVEDLQWVLKEVLEGGGDATVLEAKLVDGLSDEELRAKFCEARDLDYAELIQEVKELGAPLRRRKKLGDPERAALLDGVRRLEQRLQEITASDFFGASGRETLSGLLAELRQRAEGTPPSEAPPRERASVPRGRTWVTRTGIHVDRIASAWLIRRFIDPEAVFKFVQPKGYVPAAGELRFDMFEAEYSHEGDHCTFETLLERFELREPGLSAIAEVVHDIDLKESKFGRAETAGVAAGIAGLCRVHRDDGDRLERGSTLFESLLSYYSTKKAE